MQLKWIMVPLLILLSAVVLADEVRPINPNAGHVERWNWFVGAVYALHQKQIKGRDIRTEEEMGGYFREPEFYKEVRYFDKRTGVHLATIQWESAHPDRIHAIDVFVHDDKGRILRDYSALFLTHSRNAPQQTLINLHVYHGELHGIRQFDATDNHIGEICRGRYKGENVNLVYGDIEIINYSDVKDGPFSQSVYKTCFEGLPKTSAGRYLTPQ